LSFQCGSLNDAKKELQSLAIINFNLPGEAGFPLTAMYGKPATKNEAGRYLDFNP
jgi:actin related protein 2/3 complex subunit 3